MYFDLYIHEYMYIQNFTKRNGISNAITVIISKVIIKYIFTLSDNILCFIKHNSPLLL